MASLEIQYAGLSLKNPLILSSSGLTKNLKGVKAAAESGVGAVVLKSIFEQQLLVDTENNGGMHAESYDNLKNYQLHEHLQLIGDCKRETDIPIIASINCLSLDSWIKYATKAESAGADAIELNIMLLSGREYLAEIPVEESFLNNVAVKPRLDVAKTQSSNELEDAYIDIVREICSRVNIPVIVKISPYITAPQHFIERLDSCGIAGVVLFNSFFSPDFDINTFKVAHPKNEDHSVLMHNSLRWTALLNDTVKCSISSSGGVYSSESCIKMILAGASGVQICSAVYQGGLKIIPKLLKDIEKWMNQNEIGAIEEFRGSLRKRLDMELFSRLQYMKMYEVD